MGTADLHLDRLIELALTEDAALGDVTTAAVIPPGSAGEGRIVAREPLVVSGVVPATRVFRAVDAALEIEVEASDGSAVEEGATVMSVRGELASILIGERTALNFLQRLTGIATTTREWAEALAEGKTRLLDTRKTTPGWRMLEKAAVRHGGGTNHRIGLFDGVLIKDNHLRAAGGIAAAVRRAREGAHHLLRIEVEVEDLAGLDEAIEAGADVVLLDNMDDEDLARAVERARGQVVLEASGGMTLARLRRIAGMGLDYVSAGAITHSAISRDLALDID